MGLALLTAIDINGTPVLLKVIAGNVITFRSFGLVTTGKAELTNQEVVTFQ